MNFDIRVGSIRQTYTELIGRGHLPSPEQRTGVRTVVIATTQVMLSSAQSSAEQLVQPLAIESQDADRVLNSVF